GAITFGVDPTLVPDTSLIDLAAAPAGTQIGFAVSDVTGETTRLAVKINTSPPVLANGRPVLTGTIDVPANFAQVVGVSALPLTLSETVVPIGGTPRTQLAISIDLVAFDQRLAQAGLTSIRLGDLTLVFPGTYGYGGSDHPLAVVPS